MPANYDWGFKDTPQHQMERHNTGKPRLSLLPTAFVHAVNPHGLFTGPQRLIDDTTEVLEFGANKYSANNWRKSGPWLMCYDSMMRHVRDLLRGVERDTDSGLFQAGHIGCNMAFLLEFIEEGSGTDDRYKINRKMHLPTDCGPDLKLIVPNLVAWKDGGSHDYLLEATYQFANWWENKASSIKLVVDGVVKDNVILDSFKPPVMKKI